MIKTVKFFSLFALLGLSSNFYQSIGCISKMFVDDEHQQGQMEKKLLNN